MADAPGEAKEATAEGGGRGEKGRDEPGQGGPGRGGAGQGEGEAGRGESGRRGLGRGEAGRGESERDKGGGAARKRKFSWRALVRVVHADLGHFAVGLTFVYALSGLAVNHIADWDPNFQNHEAVHELGGPLAGEDEAVARGVLERLAIQEAPQEVYRAAEDQLEVVLARKTLHVTPSSGRVVEEGQEPRLLLRAANWLHLNRGKKAWTYVADTFAVGLLVLAVSGVLMLPGRRGLLGRGGIWLVIGVLVPVLYVHFSGGP
ncbi:PepSY-associated TM helix domain-containing protein [Chondromyces crocatus]|uniref:Peptidase n=1 Tax=Chondromyces crocatus TaxID=52 RepID=A0A0K1EQN5_CHOCO|nr:PepSY-associated TM helix domain-containing protein [Chondromyces crocatus]AKT42938.1 uncharacterized protein CMC5_071660 [Chondromyces crocatus]